MGFLKNLTIRRVTKMRFHQIMSLIINASPPRGVITDPKIILEDYIKSFEQSGGGKIIIQPQTNNWIEVFWEIIVNVIILELRYDPTIGSMQDIELIRETFYKEFKKYQ